jgi:hypothetical protein
MRRFRLTMRVLLGLCLLGLAGCAAQSKATTSQAQIPAMEPGTARVWFLRQQDPPGGNIEAATPMVFANGAPVSQIREGSIFYHDFPPGTYKFAVQPYGTPSGERDTVQLVPGTQSYVQIQWVPNWEVGSRSGGAAFAVLSMSPEVATQYLPTLAYLGQR